MLARVLIAGLFAAAAHAQSPMSALLSSKDDHFSSGMGGELKFSVVFSACVGSLDPTAFTISPAGVFSNGVCTEGADNQSYDCMFTANAPLGTPVTPVTVVLPAGSVSSIDMPIRSNRESNTIDMVWYPSFSGVVDTIPTGTVLPERAAEITYTVSDRMFWVTETAQAGVINVVSSGAIAPVIQSAALDPNGMQWTWMVKADLNSELNINMPANSVVDRAGNMNMVGDTITRSFGSIPSPCVVGPWTSYSACTPNCVGEFDATFNIVEPVKTRTRSVSNPDSQTCTCSDCNGSTNPPTSETVRCTTSADQPPPPSAEVTTFCYTGSRPYSGEFLGECKAGGNTCSGPTLPKTQTDNTASAFMEASGCMCGNGCEADGTCCQAWYRDNCGTPANSAFRFTEPAGTTFPLVCETTECYSATPKFLDGQTANYFCWCDPQCVPDGSCCNGHDSTYANSRYQVCLP